MAVPLLAPPSRSRDYVLVRGAGSGLRETERAMFTLLQPHLYQLYRDTERRRRTPARLLIAHENICTPARVTNRTSRGARVFYDTEVDP
jgi:hypothetical protein